MSQAAIIEQSIRGALRPPEDIPAHVWAERNYVVDGRAGSFSGEFTTANVGFIREPLDAIADNRLEAVVLMCAVQSLKSTTSHAVLARAIAEDPGPGMWVAQDEEEAKIMLRDRIVPSFRRSPRLAILLPGERHAITHRQVDFASMPLYMGWGGSEKRMQSKPIRWLFLDEPEQYPDNVKEAEDRTSTFWNSRTIYTGTPKLVDGILDREFKKGHRAFWEIPCMACGHWQFTHWGKTWYLRTEERPGMRWEAEDDEPWFECEACNHRHFDIAVVRHHFACEGRWAVQNPAALTPKTVEGQRAPRLRLSFTWNSITAPFMPWRKLRDQFVEASRFAEQGVMDYLQNFVNKRLGEPFDERHYEKQWIPEPVAYEPGGKWEKEQRRYMAVDVQADCRYYVVRAWAADGESRYIEAGRVVDGDAVRARQLALGVPDNLVAVDCGYDATKIYKECCQWGWFALKGDERDAFQQAEPDQEQRDLVAWVWGRIPEDKRQLLGIVGSGTNLWKSERTGKVFGFIIFSSPAAMDVLDNLMRQSGRWGYPKECPDFYREHIGAARRVTKWDNKGRRVHEWHYKKGKDHCLACEKMQVVCAIAGGQLKLEATKATATTHA